MVFVKPLRPYAQALLSGPALEPHYLTGRPGIMLEANHMRSLFKFFVDIPDPRRGQGRRHNIATVLSFAAGAVLCGMHGYQAISDWAESLGQKARERFRCRYEKGRYVVPSLSVIRDVLIRVNPTHLEALQHWNKVHGQQDETYLDAGHRQATPRINQAMKFNGGYIIHLDETHDGDTSALMTGIRYDFLGHL